MTALQNIGFWLVWGCLANIMIMATAVCKHEGDLDKCLDSGFWWVCIAALIAGAILKVWG